MPKKKLTLYSIPWSGDPAEDRIHFLGGSDTGTILGINPFKSAFTLWLEKTGQLVPEDISEKIPILVGHACEDGVAKLYEHETGHKVEEALVSFMCKEYPYLRAHVDRLVVDDPDRGLECKTTSSHNHYDYANGEVPPYYYSQCQFYMMLTGRNRWDLATLRDNTEFFVNEIDRDDEYIKTMLTAIEKFWKCVQTGTPPPVDGSNSTASSLSRLYKGGVEEPVNLYRYNDLIQMRQVAAEQEKYWKAEKQKYDNQIKDALGDHETGVSKDYTVNWKPSRAPLNQKKVKEMLGEQYEDCLGEPVRTIRIVGRKTGKE